MAVVYPVEVPLSLYRGRDPAKLEKAARYNALAEKLQTYINGEVDKSEHPSQIFSYSMIAAALGLDREDVEKVLYGVDAGGNGLTVLKD